MHVNLMYFHGYFFTNFFTKFCKNFVKQSHTLFIIDLKKFNLNLFNKFIVLMIVMIKSKFLL